jgi:hypothetical protein
MPMILTPRQRNKQPLAEVQWVKDNLICTEVLRNKYDETHWIWWIPEEEDAVIFALRWS